MEEPDFFTMQPLSRVRANAVTRWGERNTMLVRPKLAIKVAANISEWSEVETALGIFLGFLLHTTTNTALAIYASLENRAAQFRMLSAAVTAELAPHHSNVIEALLTAYIRPAMKYRDRLAHWSWGFSDDLPNDLLVSEPSDKILGAVRANELGMGGTPTVRSNYSVIYVVTEADLDRALQRLDTTQHLLMLACDSVWQKKARPAREASLHQLATEPAIQKALARHEARQKNPEAQPPSPPPEQSETE